MALPIKFGAFSGRPVDVGWSVAGQPLGLTGIPGAFLAAFCPESDFKPLHHIATWGRNLGPLCLAGLSLVFQACSNTGKLQGSGCGHFLDGQHGGREIPADGTHGAPVALVAHGGMERMLVRKMHANCTQTAQRRRSSVSRDGNDSSSWAFTGAPGALENRAPSAILGLSGWSHFSDGRRTAGGGGGRRTLGEALRGAMLKLRRGDALLSGPMERNLDTKAAYGGGTKAVNEGGMNSCRLRRFIPAPCAAPTPTPRRGSILAERSPRSGRLCRRKGRRTAWGSPRCP